MHKALLVPEILLIIFKYLIDDTTGKPLLPTLGAIARTCQSFRHVVEEVFWRELHKISALYNILPSQVRNKESQTWSLSRRMFSGAKWTRFLDRSSRVRVLEQSTSTLGERVDLYEQGWTIFLAIAALRDPPVLTPNLLQLKWQTNHRRFSPAIKLFLSPTLRSLEIDAKLLLDRVICLPLGDICPKLEDLKITGNGRDVADTISNVLRGLHCLETVACSTVDNDAFIHLAQLKKLSFLAVDMRWSEVSLDELRDRLPPDSFQNLQTLHWKDYNLKLLTEIFLMPNISPSNVCMEIERFCSPSSLRAFLHSFAARFPDVREFSLVHDTMANKRFGLQVGTPGREHQLEMGDLEPILALKALRVLNLVDLGNLELDDNLVKMIGSALPELQQLSLGTDVTEPSPPSVTFAGLLSLLQLCPKLQSVGLCFDAENMLSFGDTTVHNDHVMHLRLEGRLLGSRRAEVDGMLKRVLPGLRTVEECIDGVRWSVRDADTTGKDNRATMAFMRGGGLLAGRRTRSYLSHWQQMSYV